MPGDFMQMSNTWRGTGGSARSNFRRESRQWYRHQSSHQQALFPWGQYARRVPDDLKRIHRFDNAPLEDFLCL